MSKRIGRPPKYPWRTMQVGESFLTYGRKQGCLCNDARRYHRPKRFSTYKVMIRGRAAVRVWRIE